MKKSIFFTVAGVLVIGGITFAALHDWSGKSSQTNPVEGNSSSSLNNSNSNELEIQKGKKPYSIAFYNSDRVYSMSVLENGFSQPTLIANEADAEVIEMEKYFTTSLMPKDIYRALPISENMIFLTGLQSNLDPNLWIYSERVDEGEDYSVRSFNTATKETKILFNRKNSPNKDYAFKPFAISNDNAIVYLEAFLFDSYLNNIGIYELNLKTNKINKLNINSFYNSTPAMSPDGKYFLYTAGSQANDVHVTPTRLFVYDLASKKETKIFADEKGYVGMKGWIKSK